MNKKTYSQVLDDVAQDGVLTDLNLTPQIIIQIQKGKNTTMLLRIKGFVILLVLGAILINAPTVLAAIQHWFGYIPGFGLVSSGQLRELSEPVSMTQNGITLKVDKAILSDEKTLVKYSLEGIAANMKTAPDGCRGGNSDPLMRLPNGHDLKLNGLASSDTYDVELTFAPMPAYENDATLIIRCIDYASTEQVPQYWEVPLHFVPSSSTLTVVPVLESLATVAPTESATMKSPFTSPAQPQNGLILNNLIPTQEGYILSGTVMIIPPAGYVIEQSYGFLLEDVTLTDANGQNLQFDVAPDDFLNSALPTELPENTYFWACQIQEKTFQWPLTMTVHSVRARGPLLPQAEFRLDVGADPKVDQLWKVDREISLGTKTAHIVSVRRMEGEHGLSGYEFTLVFDPTMDILLDIKGYQRMGGGGRSNDDGTYSRVLAYPNPIPTGMLTVLVNGNELIQLSGPWQATWQKPVEIDGSPMP